LILRDISAFHWMTIANSENRTPPKDTYGPEETAHPLGPITLGRIFDLTNSYTPGYELCIVCAVAGVAVTLGCRLLKPAEKLEHTFSVVSEQRPASNF